MSAKPRRRAPASDFEIAGHQFLTLKTFAAQIGRPVDVVRSWVNRAVDPLPVVTLPSATVGAESQTRYVDEGVALQWLRSLNGDNKAKRRGRPPRHKR